MTEQSLLSSLAVAQINPTVGDIASNVRLIIATCREAAALGKTLIVFPECSLIGYPGEDLILVPSFRQTATRAVADLADYTRDTNISMVVGTLWEDESGCYNAACLISEGTIQQVRYKYELANSGVFDEYRVFRQGDLPDVVIWKDHRLGIMICEDMWHDTVAEHLSQQSPDIFIVLNASPYEKGKYTIRHSLARHITQRFDTPLLYVNQTGGQDELVFDGGSFLSAKDGSVIWQAPYFKDYVGLDIHMDKPTMTDMTMYYQAMVMGLRDYVSKNGFTSVILGLSGGIDSALTAVVAVDALGADKVQAVMLPSPYTAQISLDDAAALADNLGIAYHSIPIEPVMTVIDRTFASADVTISSLAQENIQSRSRGLLLMGMSNSNGALLLTTGNKSEMAVGYATLYGDMCGAFSVLKDVYKTDVFALSRWRNTHLPDGQPVTHPIIPERIITRAPSAELREDQTDEDSLPPYDILDAVLVRLIEDRASIDDIVFDGYEKEVVERVAHLLRISEYKRRQAPPGVKLSSLSFGRDWRMPLTNDFKR